MTRVAVLGAGSWGTTLADLLAREGNEVTLWAYEAEVVESINTAHENSVFLAGRRLNDALRASGDLATVLQQATHVVSVTPSHVARLVWSDAAAHLEPGTIVTCATKGIETDTLLLMSDVAGAVLPPHRFVALSGPSFAIETFDGQPTAVAAASTDPEAALAVQELFASRTFRVYSNQDVVGTEIAGALKNVIAIAAGILDGLGLGNNPRAALITRGLAEISRLGVALGADPLTFAGLAGMGDLILTTCGALSRNRSLGVALARGVSLERYRAEHRTVAEGANTAVAAVRLGEREGVELPIIEQVWQILYQDKAPNRALEELMERTLKPEQ
ncbi:MAG: NAD(P)H-dependent glycerol-3-phosphate dehydrogenase [Gemmatimonadales bacterium]